MWRDRLIRSPALHVGHPEHLRQAPEMAVPAEMAIKRDISVFTACRNILSRQNYKSTSLPPEAAA